MHVRVYRKQWIQVEKDVERLNSKVALEKMGEKYCRERMGRLAERVGGLKKT